MFGSLLETLSRKMPFDLKFFSLFYAGRACLESLSTYGRNAVKYEAILCRALPPPPQTSHSVSQHLTALSFWTVLFSETGKSYKR